VIHANENVKCTNQECESIVDKKPCQITYIKYDNEGMKYLYICTDCDHTWKTDQII